MKIISSLNRSILQSSFQFGVGNITISVIGFITFLILARNLTFIELGQYLVLRTVYDLITNFLGNSLNLTISKFTAEYQEDKNKLGIINAYVLIIISIISALILLIAIFYPNHFSSILLKEYTFSVGLQIILIASIFNSIGLVLSGVLTGSLNFRTLTIIQVVINSFGFISNIIFLFLFGLIGFLVSFVIVRFLYVAVLAILQLKQLQFSFFIDSRILSQLLKFFIPTTLSTGITIFTIIVFNKLIIERFSSISELNFYNVSMQIRNYFNLLPGIIQSVIFIYMSNLFGKGDLTRFKYSFKFGLILNGSFSLILIPILILFNKEVLLFFNPALQGGSDIFIMILISIIISSISAPFGQYFASLNKMPINLFVNIVWSISAIAIFYFWQSNDIKIVGISYIISYTILLLLYLYFYRNIKVGKA